MSNPLKDSGKPLFFALADSGSIDFPPPDRHGQSIRLAARSLSLMQKEALVFSTLTGRMWRLASDEGAYLSGLDEAPCPLAFMTTGMVAFFMDELLALARQRGIAIDNVRLIQDNFYTMKGSALKGTMTGGARDIELEAQIESNAGQEQLQTLVQEAVKGSPIHGLITGEHESLFSLTHNGRTIEPGKGKSLQGNVLPDPGLYFEQAMPGPGDWSDLVQRNGMTPKTEESTTGAGGSLKEEQDRILHIRGICTLEAIGIKKIEQQLFNPHGSIFYFLSEEGKENGGQGRAPDAATYIAAGLGFCFMTQLGRYAAITKKNLQECRIIQDTHFSLGRCTGGTGQPGFADPVETHVYLESDEDDDFARTSIGMGQQTCFLHALCRTDLNVNVKVSAWKDPGQG